MTLNRKMNSVLELENRKMVRSNGRFLVKSWTIQFPTYSRNNFISNAPLQQCNLRLGDWDFDERKLAVYLVNFEFDIPGSSKQKNLRAISD